MTYKKRYRMERRYVICMSALWTVSGYFLIKSFIFFRTVFLSYFVFALLCGVGAIGLIRYHRKRYGACDVEDHPALERAFFDRYARRLLNWVMVAFGSFFGVMFYIITLSHHSSLYEIAEVVFSNGVVSAVMFFFVMKNASMVHWMVNDNTREKFRRMHKELHFVITVSSIYWGIAAAIHFLLEKILVLDISPFFIVMFLAGVVIYNFTRINYFTFERKRYNRLVMITVVAVILVNGGYEFMSRDIWLTQPFINATPYIYQRNARISYNEQSGIYTITKERGDFKILQLTDIHLGGGFLSYDKDKKAFEAIYDLLNATRPDLVIVTGDLVFPVGYASFSFNNTAPVQQFAAFMRNTGIPWAYTYGNHDTEEYAATSARDLDTLYKSLSYLSSRTLLYPYTQPKITGRNNQVILIANEHGSLNQALFLIDSNAYAGDGEDGYDYIHDDQVEWYRQEVMQLEKSTGRKIPSQVFLHVPLQEYKTAYDLYQKGSDQVVHYFGVNEESGTGKVSCSKHHSKLFDVAKKLGSTTSFFCGHDHYNNSSLGYKGIRLTYGMSIDYLAMPGIAKDTKQRGATLITIHDDSSSDVEQVPLDSIKRNTHPLRSRFFAKIGL